MDGTNISEVDRSRLYPTDLSHPHQLWLQADCRDWEANFAAYRAADPALSKGVCFKIFYLHDSA